MNESDKEVNWGDVQESLDPTKQKLKEIQVLCNKVLKLQELKAGIEDELKELNKEEERYITNIIPEALHAVGMESIRLEDGTTLTVKEDIKCHLSQERKPAAFKWLDANGHGGLIKTELKGAFSKKERTQALELLKQINQLSGGRFKLDQSVHHSTLKAFIKQCLSDGVDIDEALFGIYTFKTTKIKKSKK